jgi:lysozyme
MKLKEQIKKEEGFRGYQYDDHLGNPTIGYGTLLPLTEQEAELLLNHRLNIFVSNVKSSLYNLNIKDEAWTILYHMAYQIGVGGLLKFKNMIKALENQDYKTASKEMLDSKWAIQTPNRAKRLSEQMESLG